MQNELTGEPDHTIPTQSGIQLTLTVNGVQRTLEIEPRVSLLDTLREHLDIPGPKKGCNQGACGACTVLVDGERILSCLALAVQYEGRAITTIEGVAEADELHPLQEAFVEHDGFQCGYCTPGQICSALGMLREFRDGVPSAVTKDVAADQLDFSNEELKERLTLIRFRLGLAAANAWWQQIDGSARLRWERVENDRFERARHLFFQYRSRSDGFRVRETVTQPLRCARGDRTRSRAACRK